MRNTARLFAETDSDNRLDRRFSMGAALDGARMVARPERAFFHCTMHPFVRQRV